MEAPSLSSKFSRFMKKNVVFVVMIPLIGAIHLGWMKLQEVDKFVSKEERRELPLLEGARAVKNKVSELAQPSES